MRITKTTVSILVILELALEVQGLVIRLQEGLSFNPCYSGIGFRSEARHRANQDLRVSILVILELALEASGLGVSYNTLWFQSLLFWNWL